MGSGFQATFVDGFLGLNGILGVDDLLHRARFEERMEFFEFRQDRSRVFFGIIKIRDLVLTRPLFDGGGLHLKTAAAGLVRRGNDGRDGMF